MAEAKTERVRHVLGRELPDALEPFILGPNLQRPADCRHPGLMRPENGAVFPKGSEVPALDRNRIVFSIYSSGRNREFQGPIHARPHGLDNLIAIESLGNQYRAGIFAGCGLFFPGF